MDISHRLAQELLGAMRSSTINQDYFQSMLDQALLVGKPLDHVVLNLPERYKAKVSQRILDAIKLKSKNPEHFKKLQNYESDPHQDIDQAIFSD